MLVEPFDVKVEDTHDYVMNKHYEDAFNNESINNSDSKLITINKYSGGATSHKCRNSCKYRK